MTQNKTLSVLLATLFLALFAAPQCSKSDKPSGSTTGEAAKPPEAVKPAEPAEAAKPVEPAEASKPVEAADSKEDDAKEGAAKDSDDAADEDVVADKAIGDLTRGPDVVFVPTPQPAVDKMLEVAQIRKGDVLYDLGCGDGRIVITAAKKYGVKAFGFDIDPERIKESRENVRKAKMGHLVTIKHADIFTVDLSKANVVTLYLLPTLNVKLMPQLRKLKPGSRIVSFDFDMRGAKPVQVIRDNFGSSSQRTVYKWVVPWKEEKVAR